MCDSVESSPGRKAIETMNSLHKDLVFKKPIGAVKRTRKKVLDDESYVEVRDNYGEIKLYFPMITYFRKLEI